MFRLTDSAEQDLVELWRTIAQDNLLAAERMVKRLHEQSALLSEHPQAGRARPDLEPGLRSFPVSSYLIFYRVIPEGVEIIRYVHGARLIANLF